MGTRDPLDSLADFVAKHMSAEPPVTLPAPAPAVPCPLRDGMHLWIWPGGRGEGWKTAREQADRAKALGATGVIPQSALDAPAWLAGRDDGDSIPRVEVFQQAGLQVTAGLGMDGTAATLQAIVSVIVLALSMPGVCVMGDEESERKWENRLGRDLAQAIDDAVLKAIADAFLRCVLCPWWAPEVHSQAPDRIFWQLFRHFFGQDYGAKGITAPTDDTLDMLAHSRVSYAARGIPAKFVHLAAQMYAHSLANAGRIVLSGEPVMALWDAEEMDPIFRLALLARLFLVTAKLPPTTEGLRQFQGANSLLPDGILGPNTVRAMGVA